MKIKSNSIVACSILLQCQIGAADERVARMDLDELENTYWICYQEAARAVTEEQRLDELSMQLCGRVSSDLQRRMFEGDFGRLHQWTLINRQLLVGGPPSRPHPPSPPEPFITTPH